MSKSLFVFLVIAAAVGYYLYKTNRFTEIRAGFDYTPEGVSVIARDMDLHDCKLNLTYDYSVDLPYLRRDVRVTIAKYDFKQWNGTALEAMGALGPEIEFRMRCKEGKIEVKESNRYAAGL